MATGCLQVCNYHMNGFTESSSFKFGRSGATACLGLSNKDNAISSAALQQQWEELFG